MRLVLELLQPYRGVLVIVFIAMSIEIGTGLAAPWHLKLAIDDALGSHHLPHTLGWVHNYCGFGKHALGVALFVGVATHRRRWSDRQLRRKLVHDERWSVGRQRSAAWGLWASAPAFAPLLRLRKNWRVSRLALDRHDDAREH